MTQNSFPSGSAMTRKPPGLYSVSRRPPNASTLACSAAGSSDSRSRCSRFFPALEPSVRWKPTPSPFVRSSQTYGPKRATTGRSSSSLQKAASRFGSGESMITQLMSMATNLPVRDPNSPTGRSADEAAPADDGGGGGHERLVDVVADLPADGERSAVPVGEDVVFRARSCTIDRARTGFGPPSSARTCELSITARDQSNWLDPLPQAIGHDPRRILTLPH